MLISVRGTRGPLVEGQWSILWLYHLIWARVFWTLRWREVRSCQLITTWWWVGFGGRGNPWTDPPRWRGSLLRAIQSLYSQSESCVSVHGSKLDQVGAGLRQGCALSLILFVIYMDRISRRSRGVEGLQVGDLKIASLLFADDVVLMASSAVDLQRSLDRLTAECEAAGMRISTSKSEAMVLSRKPVDCLLRVGNESLPQVKEFKYLRVLFTSEGMLGREIDRRVGAVAVVLHGLHRMVVTKRELSRKAKLSIYQSVFVPTLIYDHEQWVMTERTRSWVSLRVSVRSSAIWEGLGVEPLLLCSFAPFAPSWWCHKSYLYLVWPFVSASNHSSLPCGPCISEEEEVKCVLCLSCQFWSSDSHIHLLNFCHSQYPNLMTRLPHLIIPQFMYTAVQPIPLASWPVLSDTCYFLWPANIAQIDLLYIPWQITHMAILGFYLSACTRKNFLYMQMLVLKPC